MSRDGTRSETYRPLPTPARAEAPRLIAEAPALDETTRDPRRPSARPGPAPAPREVEPYRAPRPQAEPEFLRLPASRSARRQDGKTPERPRSVRDPDAVGEVSRAAARRLDGRPLPPAPRPDAGDLPEPAPDYAKPLAARTDGLATPDDLPQREEVSLDPGNRDPGARAPNSRDPEVLNAGVLDAGALIGSTLDAPAGAPLAEAPSIEGDRGAPFVEVEPRELAPGATVRVAASGFAPFADLTIALRREDAIDRALADIVADEAGAAVETIALPEDLGRAGVASLLVAGRGDAAFSPTLVIVEPVATEPDVAVGADLPPVRVSGRLTDEGAECPALRGADGDLYTLVDLPPGWATGDRVLVTGQPVEVSFCMQGTTLSVERIELR